MSTNPRPAIRSRHAALHLRVIVEGALADAKSYGTTPEQQLGLHGFALEDGFFTHSRTRKIWERVFTRALAQQQARYTPEQWAAVLAAHKSVTEQLDNA